jgi:hypothetical protein
MKVWPNHSRGAWQLYGHSHGNLSDDPISLSMDVGVDSHDFSPWHFDEIQAVMKVKAEAKSAHIEKRNAALKSATSSEIRELLRTATRCRSRCILRPCAILGRRAIVPASGRLSKARAKGTLRCSG